MIERLRDFRNRPWPKLEIPQMDRRGMIGVCLYTAIIIGAGWWIWFSGPRAEKFVALALGIPILMLLKSRYVALLGLLSLEIIVAFLAMGSPEWAVKIAGGLLGAILTLEYPYITYMALILIIWIDSTPYMPPGIFLLEQYIGFGLLVGWLFSIINRGKVVRIKIYFPEMIPTLLLLGWVFTTFVGWCYQMVPLGLFQVSFTALGVLFFFITPLIIEDRKKLDLALWVWGIAGMLAVIGQFTIPSATYEGSSPTGSWGYVPGAVGLQKNWAASFMTFSFFIVLASMYWSRGVLKRIVLFLCLASLIAAVLVQESKSGGVSLLAALTL